MANFHNKPFDDGTLIKLDIWRRYLDGWIPVFIHSPFRTETINIFDFFSGPGEDANGIPGSPIIALEAAKKYSTLLKQKRLHINFYFFDKTKSKTRNLETLTSNYSDPIFNISIENLGFDDAYSKYMINMNGAANLIFVDQCGIKQMTTTVFNQIAALKKTDLLFFIASSFIKRFLETNEFQQYLSAMHIDLVKDSKYSDIHRVITDFYRSNLSKNINYHIAPFSIKKGSNIYGLVFGTNHIIGIDKFLKVCWGIDPQRGEANFDIDDEKLTELPLFPELSKPSKRIQFEDVLKNKIINGTLKSDKDVYFYTLEQGFLPQHSREVVKILIKDKIIKVQNSMQPRVSKASLEEERYFAILNQ